MSYHLYLTVPNPQTEPETCHCQECGNAHLGKPPPPSLEVWSGNHTSNTAAIWREAGADLATFEGKTAGDCIEPLAAAIATIERDPERFRHHEPGNGWGTVESTLRFLRAIKAACARYPAARVEVCR